MAGGKTSSVEDEEGNLEASVKKMVASHNRKKKKSGGFQVMGMNVCVVNKKNEDRICTFYATFNSAVVPLLNVPCYPSLSLTLVPFYFPHTLLPVHLNLFSFPTLFLHSHPMSCLAVLCFSTLHFLFFHSVYCFIAWLTHSIPPPHLS